MQNISTQANILDRVFGWWYSIAAPPAVADDAPLLQRDATRRSRFMSLILLIEIIYTAFIFTNTNPIATIAVSITILGYVVGIVLNRLGKTTAAGILVLVVTELSICFGLLGNALSSGGLSMNLALATFVFVQPNLIAIALFPTAGALLFGFFNCLLEGLAIAFLPKAPDFVVYMKTSGTFSAYFSIISVQILAILLSFLWANSALQQTRRADSAEEINKLAQDLANQQQDALEQKQRLEESIQQIVNVHVQVANGNYNARVPLDSSNILWSVAGSLNNLVARLQRTRQDTLQQQRTEHALQQAIREVQQAKMQKSPLRFSKTNTTVDILMAEIGGTIEGNYTAPPKSPNYGFSPVSSNTPLPSANYDLSPLPRLEHPDEQGF